MKSKLFKGIYKTGAALFVAACLFSLFLPLPKKIAYRESYECVWSDGTVSTESYSSAYLSLSGMTHEGVMLERSGLTGTIASEAAEVYATLQNGSLGELLQCAAEGTRIDRAALYLTFSKRIWYNGAYFIWAGNNVERVSRAAGSELVALEGAVTSRLLRETGATSLHLRAGATLKADTFAGSAVTTVYAQSPYTSCGSAVYIDTAGGKRLLAAVAGIKELTLEEDAVFADRGALIACQDLTALTLPFVGSAKIDANDLVGELGYLFASGKEYFVPVTLKSLRVTGGRISSTAFYACSSLNVIDLCGVDAGEISAEAFSGLASLELLHTPKSGVSLSGEFTAQRADCDCTVYIRR